jgi:hypothetical protein
MVDKHGSTDPTGDDLEGRDHEARQPSDAYIQYSAGV